MQNKISLSKIRQMGYEAGAAKAKELLNNNHQAKMVLTTEAPCQRKSFMASEGIGRDKALRFSMIFGFGFDKGVRDTVLG